LKYLLDSSAWLAHLFSEPGVDQVNQFFADEEVQVSICALSIVEVFTRLKAIGRQAHWVEVWDIYKDIFDSVIAVDEVIAHQALRLRTLSTERLPTIDGLIAAAALVGDLTLVHRDPHLTAIDDAALKRILLPSK
jgi:predicted nucleic acid-binding protein